MEKRGKRGMRGQRGKKEKGRKRERREGTRRIQETSVFLPGYKLQTHKSNEIPGKSARFRREREAPT